MNRSWAAAVLAAAIVSALPSISFAQVKPPADPAPARKADAPAGQTEVPVKQVVLFSSGVGYFEHYGCVAGNGSAELRFKTAQINDVLKSLVLQDLDKGSVGAVTYPSQEPIARTLRSFQVDITSNPTLADLLNQLRGAKIDIVEAGALDRHTKGTIVGVEKRQDRVGDKNQIVDYWVLNLKVGNRFRSISLNQMTDFALEDPKLEEELDKALSAVAQARDQDKKPVNIQFRGEGNRRVRIGYVVETPIWKTSYRLVLGKEEEKPKAVGEKNAIVEPGLIQLSAGDLPMSSPLLDPRITYLAGEPVALTDAQIKSMQSELEVVKSWADGMDPQYGGPHPAVAAVRARQKELEAALKDGRLPKDIPALPKSPDAGDRKNLEDEIEVLKIWFPGMESGYGKDHPAIVWARNHIAAVEKLLAEPEGKKGPAAVPGEPGKPGAGAGAKDTKSGKLQGWAIIENQTDNDWTDVQLSLVSGRPLSYIQDLYNPLYIPRPVVYPNLLASLRPQTYTGGISEQDEKKILRERGEQQQMQNENLQKQQASNSRSGRNAGGGGGGGGLFGNAKPADGKDDAAAQPPLDPTASVVSAASAAQLGELFEYTVGNVTLPRQKSAMIPIVTDDISVEKVSIYNESVLPRYPLNGVKIKNTTDKHLLSGPVTVLEAGTYAGDARLDDVPPGQSRLLSYGIDLSVLVDPEDEKTDSTIRAGKLVKGVLYLTRKEVQQQTYAIQNKGKANRTVIIEHPREEGWTLVTPAKFEEKTDQVYRFRTQAEAGKVVKLPVQFERVNQEETALVSIDNDVLLEYSRTDGIPDAVRNALSDLASRRGEIADLQKQIDERKKQIAEVTAEQNRIRDNMKTVAQSTDYYNRLLKKLDEQETSIEKLQTENADLNKQRETKGKQLEAFVAGLSVG